MFQIRLNEILQPSLWNWNPDSLLHNIVSSKLGYSKMIDLHCSICIYQLLVYPYFRISTCTKYCHRFVSTVIMAYWTSLARYMYMCIVCPHLKCTWKSLAKFWLVCFISCMTLLITFSRIHWAVTTSRWTVSVLSEIGCSNNYNRGCSSTCCHTLEQCTLTVVVISGEIKRNESNSEGKMLISLRVLYLSSWFEQTYIFRIFPKLWNQYDVSVIFGFWEEDFFNWIIQSDQNQYDTINSGD